MTIETWADFGALSKEDLDAYTPEDLDSLKTSIQEKENKLVEERKLKDEEAAKAKELADNYKIRSEKAEAELKGIKKEPEVKDDLGSKDLYALIEAKVPQEDIDEIVEYAKFKKISVAEALKLSVVKTTLEEKAELRKSADVTNTRKTPPIPNKLSDDAIVKDAFEKDKIPEAGSKEAEQLFWARKGGKR